MKATELTDGDKLTQLKRRLGDLKQEIDRMHMKESLMRTQVEAAREKVQQLKMEKIMKRNWNSKRRIVG